MTHYFLAGLNVANKDVLVVGNDREAADKGGRLAECGARVRWIKEKFTLDQIGDPFLLVYCHKENRAEAAQVADVCRKKKILLCAIDLPEYCDIVNLAIFERGHLAIGISTQGVSPTVARRIRIGLEESLKDSPIESFMEKLATLREDSKKITDPDARREKLIAAAKDVHFKAELRIPS